MKTQAITVGIVMFCACAAHAAEPTARAVEFERRVIYEPPENPGFAAWVQLWREPKGDLMVKFLERRKPRKGEVVVAKKIDLDYWEAVGLPVGYDFGGLISEAVYMRSSDAGKTWREVNRTGEVELNRAPDSGCFSPVALEDGRLLSVSWGMPGCLRESKDLGTTWTKVRELMDGERFEVYPFVMRVLSDRKTLVIFCPYNRAWGNGKAVAGRLHTKPGEKAAYQAALFFSQDFGKTLTGPIGIFQGVPATEVDFCEMPNGDLLFTQHGQFDHGNAHRQIVRKTKLGYVPDQMEKSSGNAPEIFVRTKEGYLVGASRNAPYVWSDDDGVNWYPLADIPNCEYQPRAMLLDDDRILFTWHHGGDLPYGQVHEYIGSHTFKLKVDQVKQRTKLTLSRVFDKDKGKYVCAFDAKLITSEGKPVAGKPIEFAIVGRGEAGYEEFGGSKPWEKGKRQVAKTDANGIARVVYPDQDAITDIHRTFQIAARFDPERQDGEFSPAASLTIEYYAVTPR
jgi:hypothetical protein